MKCLRTIAVRRGRQPLEKEEYGIVSVDVLADRVIPFNLWVTWVRQDSLREVPDQETRG